ncbi:MAG: 16S rRNA (adenine(1518)-N(6)/adenine(1519)-N(6))-dimethyltransferase RsmA [Planctomycetota bacterium]
MAQTLSDIKRLLAEHGLRPKKKFGQNFLHDGNHLAKILQAAVLAPGDLVLEVGPGTGALTERLVEAGARVVAVEIDTDLKPILEQRVGDQVAVHFGDALSGKHAINPEVLALLDGPFKLIANLPYNVASPLIANLALDHPAMSHAVVMVQKEVADRLVAPPGNKQYGTLGVLAQAIFEVHRVCTLSPGCFYPPPTIDSSVVAMARRDRPLCDDPHALSRLLQTLFSKRRKQIGSILGRDQVLPPGVSADQRPEQLTVEQLCSLTRRFTSG